MHEENWEQQNHHIVVTGEKCIMTWSIIVTRRKETKINGSNDLQRNNLTLILPLSPSTLTPPPPDVNASNHQTSSSCVNASN
jgi:hypothetical protein